MADRNRNASNPDLSRRRFLQGSAMAGVATFLAGCTGRRPVPPAAPTGAAPSTAPASAPASVAPSPSAAATPKVASGPLKFANWPAYIDLGDKDSYTPGASALADRLREEVRRQGRLRGEDRRERGVRRDDQAGRWSATSRPAGTWSS